MPTEVIPIGMPVLMTQNQVYALPAVECVLYTDATAPAFEVSNTQTFTNKNAPTLTGGSVAVSAGFIRATGSATLVTLKRD